MLVTLLGMVTLVRPQPLNAPLSMLVVLFGIVRLVSLRQLAKALIPMLVTLLGMLTLVRPVQLKNERSPIFVILLGMATLVIAAFVKNAWPPILVTGRPLMVSGMVTAPPEPLYPVIVIAP